MAASSTRSLAVGQRLHHLKVFFSNRFVYAQVTRKTDGHVRAAPPRAFFRLILGARARNARRDPDAFPPFDPARATSEETRAFLLVDCDLSLATNAKR